MGRRVAVELPPEKGRQDRDHDAQRRPALSWKSQVVYFKVVKPDHPVSYGSTWQSDHMVRVVTIPVGYGDGYFRSLSNQSEVIIRGKRYPVVGLVCMDQMMVNIEWTTAYNGDEVILIGESDDLTSTREAITCGDLARWAGTIPYVMLIGEAGDQAITVGEMDKWAGTIPYEILTNINTRVPRVYVSGDG